MDLCLFKIRRGHIVPFVDPPSVSRRHLWCCQNCQGFHVYALPDFVKAKKLREGLGLLGPIGKLRIKLLIAAD